jgi:asparagine synthase (glutamine-hydrolysing)
MVHDVLLSERALQRDCFNQMEITNLLTEHGLKVANHDTKLWDCLMLELWHRAFIDVGTGGSKKSRIKRGT